MADDSGVFLCVDQDGWTKSIQISIEDEHGGYRIAGPKFNGSSRRLKRHRLTERDLDQLSQYIGKARAVSAGASPPAGRAVLSRGGEDE